MGDREHRKKGLTPEQKWQIFLEASRKNAADAEGLPALGHRAAHPIPSWLSSRLVDNLWGQSSPLTALRGSQ